MAPKPRDVSYSEGLMEGSPKPASKNLTTADISQLQANIGQVITTLTQLKAGMDKQNFEKLRDDVQLLVTDSASTQRFQDRCNEMLNSITTTAENRFKELNHQVQEIEDSIQALELGPSKEEFDSLFAEVRKIDSKLDTLNQKALERAQSGDAVTGTRSGEDNVDVDNDGTGAIDLHEGPENHLSGDHYRGLPQNGSNLTANREKAIQGGGRAPASLGATPQTHTHRSQRTQAAANDEQFWVHIKLCEIKPPGIRIRGGQEVMRIKVNSTLRDLEIQIENFVKKLQKGDISKRSNLKEPNLFYWSTEHVVDNIKAMKDMDADENTWGGELGDGAMIINEDNDIGVMDWLKREQQMPWLSVTIKLNNASER